MTNFTHYLISDPFPGHIHTLYDPARDRVAYDDRGLTLEEYKLERPELNLRTVDETELGAIWKAYKASLVTEPEPIDVELWEDLLNVLPPCRWQTVQGVDLFHISERLTDDLVTWVARIGDRRFQFVDFEGRPAEELACKVLEASQ